jgi:electron transfer flavoprotein beta subunit
LLENCGEIQNQPQPLAVAHIFKSIVSKEVPQLVIFGKQAIDDDSNATGQMLAGLLNWPQVTATYIHSANI